jgi:phospholipid/cholesterol/gamma-HCH transport system substrate-binding protein
MRRALRAQRRNLIAVAALVVLALATVIYILEHQPAFTLGHSYYTVKAQFASASAVTPGQGQAVTIAGVQVGLIGGVEVKHGRAVVDMDIYKRYAPIYRDATVLLRPRTPLKDMYLELDPGTRSAGKVADGGELPIANTEPDIDVDQILGSLDADTRTYLLLLLSGGAQALSGRGGGSGRPSPSTVAALQQVLKRFGPIDRHALDFTKLLSTRDKQLSLAIHDLNLVAGSLGGVDVQLASLVRSSDKSFGAIASQDKALSSALAQLPSTLTTTRTALGKVKSFASATGPALSKLTPFAKDLGPALAAVKPLAQDTTKSLSGQLRPFARAVQPFAKLLTPTFEKLAAVEPQLTSSVKVINTLFNELAYKAAGSQSYLFWGAWFAHILDSLTSTQDANGVIVQGLFMAPCASLNLLEVALEQSDPGLGPILKVLNPPDWSKIKSSFCPKSTTLVVPAVK